MRVLIVGGAGLAGRALIRELLDAGGADITVLSRAASSISGVKRVIVGHYGELSRTAEFGREVAQMDAVVHLADGLPVLEHRTDVSDTALADRLVAASADLASAALEARVPLFAYVSSIKAICDEEDDRVLVETSKPRATTLYGRSKLRVEQSLSRAFAGSATRTVVLRPPVLYGEVQRGSLSRLLRLADTPWPLPLGNLTNKRSVLNLSNLASLLGHLVRNGAPQAQGVFHVHDGPPLSTTQIVTALRRGLGRPRRLFSPAIAGHVARLVPYAAPVARRLYGSLEISDAHLRRSLAWTPVIDTETALVEMARRYVVEG
jgi:nucleoside-diphosphate-sugar epimerase